MHMSTDIRSCEDALRLLAAHLDGELDDSTHVEVERHLSRCRSCYSRADFERHLKSRVAEFGREPVTVELSKRVKEIISMFELSSSD